jgi:hypothetical protein
VLAREALVAAVLEAWARCGTGGDAETVVRSSRHSAVHLAALAADAVTNTLRTP